MFNTALPDDLTQAEPIWARCFVFLIKSGQPFLQTIVWMNDNFSDIYRQKETDIEVYEYIFDHFKIQYKKDPNINKTKDKGKT